MPQAWVQVAGLIVEFAGVLLLAWQWFCWIMPGCCRFIGVVPAN